MDWIFELDRSLFLIINKTLANPVFDFSMPIITNADYWMIPLFLVWLALIIFGGAKGRTTALLIVILVALSDQLTSGLIKPWVRRLRPCHPDHLIEGARYLIGLKKSMSFPSSHAANNAAIATLLTIRYPKWKWIPIIIAVLVSYSRIYVGVHFPIDVFGGIVIGFGCALVVLKCKERFDAFVVKLKKKKLSLKNTETTEIESC